MTALTPEELLAYINKQQKIQNEEAVVEDEDDDKDDSEDDDKDDSDTEVSDGMRKQRSSKSKLRKAMLESGMKHIASLRFFTMEQSENEKFEIRNAEIFVSQRHDCFFFAGEAIEQHSTSQHQTQDEDEDEVDDTGIDPEDIELVMTHSFVSRSKAVEALKAADGDLANAVTS